jgi:hypothetical protein
MHGHMNITFSKYLPDDKVSHPKRLESSVQGIISLEVKDRKVTPISWNFNGEEWMELISLFRGVVRKYRDV